MSVNVISIIDNLLDRIRTASLVSEAEIGPPEISQYMYKYMNFPGVRMWENGYQPVFNKVTMQGRLRQYDLNYAVIVKNPQDERLSNAYREIIAVEDKIDALIYSETAKTITDIGPIIISQSSSGTRPIQQKDVDYYLVMRVVQYKIQVVEFTPGLVNPYDPSAGSPDPVSGLILVNIGPQEGGLSGIRAQWTASGSSDLDHYEFAMVLGPAAPTAPRLSVAKTETSIVMVITEDGVAFTAGQTYYFHIWAYDIDGNASTEVSDSIVFSP